MKKQYIAPELEKIIFDVEDIITHSMATENSDNVTDASEHVSGWFSGNAGTFTVDEHGNTNWFN